MLILRVPKLNVACSKLHTTRITSRAQTNWHFSQEKQAKKGTHNYENAALFLWNDNCVSRHFKTYWEKFTDIVVSDNKCKYHLVVSCSWISISNFMISPAKRYFPGYFRSSNTNPMIRWSGQKEATLEAKRPSYLHIIVVVALSCIFFKRLLCAVFCFTTTSTTLNSVRHNRLNPSGDQIMRHQL